MKFKRRQPFLWAFVLCTALSIATSNVKVYASSNNQTKDSVHYYLKEIVLSASFITDRRSPIRVATVDHTKISGKSTGKTFPELIKDIPGVYATSETGSYGDAKINIRGFKQENISVMLNGIPISGLVTGNMFWNNWLGLADATHSIQIQKGIGASMLSDNSVGGTVNIITKTGQKDPSQSFGFSMTDYGLKKSFIEYNSGESSKGRSLSFLTSYAWGSEYPTSTDLSALSYIINYSQRINPKNSLLVTILGSPETHEQRSARLSKAEIDEYGYKYNKNWGYYNGQKRNLSKNFYHKPYLTVHHFYNPSKSIEVSNSAYLSVGHGGGRWSQSKGKRIIDYRLDGQIDWNSVINENRNSAIGESKNILTNYLAGHTQTGLKTNIAYKANNWKIDFGVHYQYYTTWEKEKIIDLLGGEYWFEDYQNNSLAGLSGRDPIKKRGDFIRTNNGKNIHHLTTYLSANYFKDGWDIRVGSSIMRSSNQRWDKYNYTTDIYSKTASATGYSLKGAISKYLTPTLTYYINGAIYDRVPYNNLFFSSGNNSITQNVKNERNYLSETGLRKVFSRGYIEATAYYAYWKNKSIISDPYKQQDNTTQKYLIQGLDALHYGIEINGQHTINHIFSYGAYLSVGKWRWKNDVTANIYDSYSGAIQDQINVYSNGLPVGDAPQTQFGLYTTANILPNLSTTLNWSLNADNYADFDPVSRQNSADREKPFKLPTQNTLDISLLYNTQLYKTKVQMYANINNVLNSRFIERGRDGFDHSLNSFRGFWNKGRNTSFGLRISL